MAVKYNANSIETIEKCGKAMERKTIFFRHIVSISYVKNTAGEKIVIENVYGRLTPLGGTGINVSLYEKLVSMIEQKSGIF